MKPGRYIIVSIISESMNTWLSYIHKLISSSDLDEDVFMQIFQKSLIQM